MAMKNWKYVKVAENQDRWRNIITPTWEQGGKRSLGSHDK